MVALAAAASTVVTATHHNDLGFKPKSAAACGSGFIIGAVAGMSFFQTLCHLNQCVGCDVGIGAHIFFAAVRALSEGETSLHCATANRYVSRPVETHKR